MAKDKDDAEKAAKKAAKKAKKAEKKAQAAGGPTPVLTLLTGTTPAPALGEDPCDD